MRVRGEPTLTTCSLEITLNPWSRGGGGGLDGPRGGKG